MSPKKIKCKDSPQHIDIVDKTTTRHIHHEEENSITTVCDPITFYNLLFWKNIIGVQWLPELA